MNKKLKKTDDESTPIQVLVLPYLIFRKRRTILLKCDFPHKGSGKEEP